MTDRYPMPYMMHADAVSIGLTPYAVYGGKVYSFTDKAGKLVPHGTQEYRLAYEEARATELEAIANRARARGA